METGNTVGSFMLIAAAGIILGFIPLVIVLPGSYAYFQDKNVENPFPKSLLTTVIVFIALLCISTVAFLIVLST
jgi:hypothetical protein